MARKKLQFSSSAAEPMSTPRILQVMGRCTGQHSDETTDETTSHSATPPKNDGQAAGYSHLTDETTSHSTRLSKTLHSHLTMLANALHSHSAKSPKDGDISRWLTPTKSLVNDN